MLTETSIEDQVERFLKDVNMELSRLNCIELFINGEAGVFAVDSMDLIHASSLSYPIDVLADVVRFLSFKSGNRIDSTMPSGGGFCSNYNLRWHAILAPVAQDGAVISLRRQKFHDLTMECFEVSPLHFGLIERAVMDGKSILISGPTGAGKTSFMSAILRNWHLSRRVVIVESVPECPALSPTWIRLCETVKLANSKGGFSIAEIARAVLRMRPDRLVVGELRSNEAEIFYDLSLTGHGGCISTIHANSVRDALLRFQCMLSDLPRDFLKSMQLLVVQINRTNRFEIIDAQEVNFTT